MMLLACLLVITSLQTSAVWKDSQAEALTGNIESLLEVSEALQAPEEHPDVQQAHNATAGAMLEVNTSIIVISIVSSVCGRPI